MNRAGFAAILVLGALLVASVPLAATGKLSGLLVTAVVDDALHAPPQIRLESPRSGAGGEAPLLVAGEARAAPGEVVTDVQVRIDGGRWASLPDAPRGVAVSAFRESLDLDVGDHAVEARAWDGKSYSLPARALVRLGAPTVTLAAPPDGAGLRAGPVPFSGTVEGASTVIVEADGVRTLADVEGNSWTALVNLGPGTRTVRVVAQAGNATSLPAEARIATSVPPPPTVEILAPRDGDAFAAGGQPECEGCVLVRGVVTPGATLTGTLDGDAPEPIAVAGGAWTWKISVDRLLRGAHAVTLTPSGGGVPRSVTFDVRAPRDAGLAGDEAPRLTGTPLSFRVDANLTAAWRLDGEPLPDGPAASFSLAQPGAHALHARIVDARGRAALVDVPLLALNRAPLVTLRASPGPAIAEIPFRANATDADGAIARYAWDFGDGTTLETTAPHATHRYALQGLYRASVVARDDRGAPSAPATLLVAVANAPPDAAFSFDPPSPTLLTDVAFADLSTDPEGYLASRSWDFGDGATSHEANPVHRFATRGEHVVTLRVADEQGAVVVATRNVTVVDIPPTPAFVARPAAPRAGEDVAFADASTKPDGALASWSWDFGDGTRGVGALALHAYAKPGAYDVKLTVTDDMGVNATLARTLVVADAAPDVRDVLVDPAQPVARENVRFRLVAAHEPARVEWDFGDGSTSADLEPVHGYLRSGAYAARVRATNAENQSVALRFDVVVANARPVARLAQPDASYAGYSLVLRSAAFDPDGSLVRYRFDADGDGNPECDGAAPQCAFVYPAPGAYLARLDVLDDEGASASVEAPVVVQAPPPELAAPRVAFELPAEGAALQGQAPVRGSATTNRTLVALELQLRNGSRALAAGADAWMPASGNASWQLLLDTTAFPDGEYQLVARATDAQGAQGFAQRRVLLQNGPAEDRFELRIANAPEEPVGPDVDLEGSAYHPLGVTSVRYSLDGAPWRDAVGPTHAFTLPLRGLPPGEHVVVVDAFRGALERKELPVKLRVAQPPPALVVDEPPSPLAYGLVHAAGRVEGQGEVLWRLDAGLWQAANRSGSEWRLDHATGALPAGKHTLSLKPVGPDGSDGEAREYAVRVIRAAGDEAAPAPVPTPVRHESPGFAPLLALAALAWGASRRRL